jgi:biopolymer transport protein ExbD
MRLGDAALAAADLNAALRAAAASHHSLVVATDKKVPYQRVVDVIDQARSAGFEKLAIQPGGAAP